MYEYTYLVVGGGVAAGYAAKEFAKRGTLAGTVAIVSSEAVPPYQRPHVSKEYIVGQETLDEILVNPISFYAESGIDLHLGTTITEADLDSRVLRSEDGTEFSFEKLLIATGTRVRRLGVPGSDLAGIHYLRDAPDADRIREAASGATRAVVVGGSFIGMEAAAQLSELGLPVTMVFPGQRVWESAFTPEMSAWFHRLYASHGVKMAAGARVTGFGGEGTVQSVALNTGASLEADLVVAGVGVLPNTELFAESGLAMENGIVVDDRLETNLPGIYAAGDVARFTDSIAGKTRRIEHWDTARRHGRAAAGNMLGDAKPYEAVRYFYSDVFHTGWELWGDPDLGDQIVYRGDVEAGPFTVWWLAEEKLVALFTFDPPQDGIEKLAGRWIRRRQQLSAAEIADESKPLAKLGG
jgi:NADPH-dependent 2,4-dienoyl-CoA reductase/sulfur reductase-like enzyme